MPINRRSRNITEGVARAPNRSMFYAMGYENGDFAKPMIGVANGHSTITPCNSGLQKLADIAITTIKEAGGNAQVFGTPNQPGRPARATVQVASLVDEGQLVEIEAVAVRTHKPK